MILSDLSIRRPIFAAVMMLALVTLGLFSYRRLSVEMFPNVEIPVISIVTRYPGASPETVEREVSKRIEEAVNQVAGVKHVYSTSREGVSTVIAEFHLEEKLNEVAQESRSKIASIRGQLPDQIEDPIIQKLDFNALPVASLAVQSTAMTPRDLTVLVEKKIKRRFESVAGVGKVDLVGTAKREVNVLVDPVRLESLGLGVNDLVNGLKSENVNTPVGRITRSGAEYPMRISGKPAKVDDFRTMVIARKGERPVTLGEVAEVRDGVEERRSLALVNGVPAVALDIYKQSGANQVAVVDAVRKVMEKLKPDLPPGVELVMVRDASIMTRESLADVQETLVIGGILTILIVFLFINSWRSTVITGITLPISVISSYIIMNAMGMTLNVMTLMALSLAIGLLIDDAIVVRENIVRHLERGKEHMEAARFGTSEIGLAVFATTCSILAVFVPVAYMRGIVGRFFFQFGITVAFAVLVSLFVSFTLDPMLSSRWNDPAIHSHGKRKGLGRLLERFNDWFDVTADRYRSAIAWALDHRKTVMVSAVAALVAGLVLMGSLEGSFMTNYDKGEFQIGFKTAPDASISESEGRLQAMLAALKEIPEIDHTYSTIGAGDSGTVRMGVVYVKLKERGERKRNQYRVQSAVREKLAAIPGITVSIEEAGGGHGGQKPLMVNLKGEDLALLKKYGSQLKEELYKVPGIVDLEVTLEHDIPEYRMHVDREIARVSGVSTGDIVGTLGKLVGGEVISTYEDEDGDAVDVRVRLPERLRQYPVQAKDLKVSVPAAAGNALVPLASLVSYDIAATPSEINRRDLSRQITVSANLDGIPVGSAMKKVQEAMKRVPMEPGYSFSFSGEGEDMIEAFMYMLEALVLAIVFVYLILAAQFESFFEPLAIMLSLPLSIVGMGGMLKITGDTLNIMSLIGLIMLMGLVTKNAILLVDYAKVLQRRGGKPRREAVIEAGRTRLRPIVMTTAAMIFGMLPLFFAIGSGAEMRAPMARAVVGGLLTSSLLTLLVVPVMYTYMDDFGAWLKRRWRRAGSGKVTALVFLVAAGLLSAAAAHAADAPRPLTLQQALAIASQRNRDVEKAREYRNYVLGRYVEERAAALPRFSVDASATRSRDVSTVLFAGSGRFADQGLAQLNLNQALFTWGQIGAAIRAAKEGMLLAEEQVRLYRQAALKDVTAAFYDVLLARELTLLARHNQDQKKRHLEEAKGKYALGVATDYDVLAATVAEQNARPEVVRTENALRTSRERLRFLLGDPGAVDAAGTLEGDGGFCPTYEEAMATALRRRPELIDLGHRRRIDEELATIAAAGDKPRLDLKAGVGYGALDLGPAPAGTADSFGGRLSGSGTSWNVGLVLSWPLFDGLKTRGKVAQARSDLESLAIEERRTVEAIRLQVRESVDAVKEAQEIVAGIAGTVAQAERLLAMAEKGYELGVKNRIDVEDAELNLLQAKSSLARAQRDLEVACTGLRWSMGGLGDPPDEESGKEKG